MYFPLLIIKPESGKKWTGEYRFLGNRLASLRSGLDSELSALDVPIDASGYSLLCFATGALFGITIFLVSVAALISKADPNPFAMPILLGGMFFGFFFFLNLFYPKLLLRIRGEEIDRELAFALRDMALQIEGGIPLYDVMVDISQSDYGAVSREFAITVHEISAGYSEKAAFERMALRTQSDFLKKSLWRIVTVISSGANLAPALKQIAETIKISQLNSLKDYASSLNFLIWIYLLIAVVLPSMGITFLVVYASFSAELDPTSILYPLVAVTVFIQIAIIGYISRTKPKVSK